MLWNFEKLFFVFKIIAFELVARISLVINRQRVNKQPLYLDLIQDDVFRLNLSWIKGKLG